MSKPNHVMIDLETFGNGPTSVIVSIGAVRFDRSGWTDDFEAFVNPDSSLNAGMKCDMSTILWWMRQSDDARAFLQRESGSIDDALRAFTQWLGEDATVWGNGSDFDNVILANAYKCCEIDLPWEWRRNRCYRTIKNLCCEIERPPHKVLHQALEDARNQSMHLIACLESLGRINLLGDQDSAVKDTRVHHAPRHPPDAGWKSRHKQVPSCESQGAE